MSTIINVANTNARSLCPKIDSLIDCFEEMDATIGIITETRLSEGESLERDIYDLAKGAGLGMICLNRQPGQRGVSHGGMAVVHNTSDCTLVKLDLPNPDEFEVLVTLSTIPVYARKLLTVACYLPPNYTVGRSRAALDHIEDVVQTLKSTYKDPFIIVGGDFNQWPMQEALQDFPDITEAAVGPTRKDRCIDGILVNFGQAVEESGTVLPLEPEPGYQGTKSDHRVAFVRAALPKLQTFEWVTYQYRYYSERDGRLRCY